MQEKNKEQKLKGKRFLTTRPKGKSDHLIELLSAEGAETWELPLIETSAISLDDKTKSALKNIASFQWVIFTSANAVHFFMEAMQQFPDQLPFLQNIKKACIGIKTAEAVARFGYVVDFVANKANSSDFGIQFNQLLQVQKKAEILWPTSNLSQSNIPEALQSVGSVTKVVIYQTLKVQEIETSFQQKIEQNQFDLAYFFSPSAFESFHNIIPAPTLPLASIGPVTTACIKNAGLTPVVESNMQTEEGIFEATLQYFDNINRNQKI